MEEYLKLDVACEISRVQQTIETTPFLHRREPSMMRTQQRSQSITVSSPSPNYKQLSRTQQSQPQSQPQLKQSPQHISQQNKYERTKQINEVSQLKHKRTISPSKQYIYNNHTTKPQFESVNSFYNMEEDALI